MAEISSSNEDKDEHLNVYEAFDLVLSPIAAIEENADELDAKLLDAIAEVKIRFIIGLKALHAFFTTWLKFLYR